MQISEVSSSKSFLALLQDRNLIYMCHPLLYIYLSLPCTNTSRQRHLTPITLWCVLTPSTAITSQCWYIKVQHYPVAWLSVGDTVVGLEHHLVLNAPISLSCSTLKLLKVVFICHYCMWYCPVRIVSPIVTPCVCVCDCESISEKNKTKELDFKEKVCCSLQKHNAIFCLHLVFLRATCRDLV